MYKFLRKIKKNIIGTISIGIILSVLLTALTPVGLRADGDKCIAENITLTVNGTDTFNVKAVSPYYENNTYVSLRDMALALAGTEKNFNVYVSSSEISITTGADYETLGNDPFSDSVTS